MTEPRDFSRIFDPRLEKAIKAISLLENGAAKRYEATAEDAKQLLKKLEGAVQTVREAFSEVLLESPPDAPKNEAPSTEDDPQAIVVANGRGPAVVDTAHQNTASSDPLTIPHWTQVSAFVELMPRTLIPTFITHISNRVYEDELKNQG